MTALVGFDDLLFDAEIIVERYGCSTFTTVDLGRLLGAPTDNAARQRTNRLLSTGAIPRAAHPGGQQAPDRWSKDQAIRIVADHVVPA